MQAESPAIRIVKGACPHDCPDTCALKITVENGRAIKVQGAADHASTHGALCTKVSRYPERTYHPERLLRPMRRVSRKDEAPRFEPVSWDEAMSDIAARLKPIAARDPEAILPYSYAGTMGMVQGEGMAARFFNKLGASRLDRTICASAGGAAMNATYGHRLGMHLRFYAESRLILIWGSNSIASNLHFWTYANQAKRNGAKLICIDPRKTETADKCHQHIALLPGSDGALALGLMHELIRNGWLDQDYIDNYVDGWDELRERALQWPPERVAEVCGISPEEVRGLARDYGTTSPAAIRLNYGMQRVRGGGNAVRLIALLPCLTGAWRHRAGGMLLTASGWVAPFKNVDGLEKPELLAGRTPRMINMSTIGDDLLRESSAGFGPKIEAVIVYNSNPVAVAPESPKVVKGFQREDLFTVVLEHFMTDTADLADYVLPATTQLEHLDVHASYGHTSVLINEVAIEPVGEARPNTEFFRLLAARMGFDDACFAETDEQLARQAFTSEIDFEALREQGWQDLPLADAPFANGGFRTPSGKALAGGADFVPNYESRASTPELAARYPLAMISPPARNFLNSSFVNVKSLRDIEGEPILEIHATDAVSRGIADGSMVRAFNDRGSYLCKASISPRARPGVVNGLGVWWRKLGAAGSNVNEVTHQRLTDLGRAPSFYDCLVEVAPA
ncbi:molybdopterin-dependent oxidoreductase [Paucibacter sp. JuS9]|uniref:molybdopterin-containing oxidoreductase family protein n=1 Tax=Paucibacter sp. JuS9 TaxID=3228748 RepID=UPI003757F2C0